MAINSGVSGSGLTRTPVFSTDCREGYLYMYIVYIVILSDCMYLYNFLPKPKNWVGLAVVNIRAVKNAVHLQKKSCKIILRLDKLIKMK